MGIDPIFAQCVTHVPGLCVTNVPGLYPPQSSPVKGEEVKAPPLMGPAPCLPLQILRNTFSSFSMSVLADMDDSERGGEESKTVAEQAVCEAGADPAMVALDPCILQTYILVFAVFGKVLFSCRGGRPTDSWSLMTVAKHGSPPLLQVEPEQLSGPNEPVSRKEGPERSAARDEV